jgi:hypothetical protein
MALLISAAAYFTNDWLGAMPEPKPDTVSESEFSASRAMSILENLLQEGIAHPVGSEANKRVKERILSWLVQQDIQAEVQETWGCSTTRPGCAWVENIIAEIPGKQSSPYLVLMAHYDSVPPAPGAGDDGAGMAAVLEIGRMLKQEGPFQNPILLVITDAEEVGLLGAEAFFAHHPKKDLIGAVVNVEGSGTSGPSQLLRTAMSNKSLIDAYGDETEYPKGMSLISEIFKRMPNDTDFSVSIRADIPGIDFAFAGERNHYHTPNDNLQNLDLRTLQHHGENVLPLARTLASIDLNNLEDSSLVYSDVYGSWISWSVSFSLFLVLFSVVLLLIASAKLGVEPLKCLLASFIPLLVITCISLALFANFKLIEWFNGATVSWPANDLPFRIVLFSVPAVIGFAIASWLNKFLDREHSLLGVWWFWCLLAAVFTFVLPDAANLLILPLVIAAVLVPISAWLPAPMRTVLQLATLIMVVPASLGMVLLLEESQGYRLIVTTFFSLGLFTASIAPFVRGALVRASIVMGLLGVVGGTVAASTMPLYSAWRPQHLNFYFVQDNDAQVAYWRVQANEPVPEKIMNILDFSEENRLYPWSESTGSKTVAAEILDVEAPSFEIVKIDNTGEGREVMLNLSSNSGGDWMMLVFPGTAGIIGFSVAGEFFEANLIPWGMAKDSYSMVFSGVQSRVVPLTVHFSGQDRQKVYFLDGSSELPQSGSALVDKRAPLATPVHRGDQRMQIHQFSL